MEYIPRILDAELSELLAEMPAIHIAGAKATGKTATASRRAGSMVRLDSEAARLRIEGDPGFLPSLVTPILLDEWQRMPSVWDTVRRSVDDGPTPGRFLLTGSAHPRDAVIHSGAGRIISLRMRPMALAERRLVSPTVGLTSLLAGAATIEGASPLVLPDYVEEALASGFPGIRRLSGRGRASQLASYVENIIYREFPEQGYQLRAPDTLRRWLRSYAAAAGTTASYAKILNAAMPGELNPAKKTAAAYRDVLDSLWLLDSIPAWMPGVEPLGRLAESPKHFLADPALAAVLLDVTADDLLDGDADRDPVVQAVADGQGRIAGRLFEQLVALSLKTYAQAAGARVSHLRTRNGDHEIDFIVELGRSTVAFEVKLSPIVRDEDVRHLIWLRERLGPQLKDAVIVTTGPDAYRRRDGVAVVPAALLGV
ncbi:MAG: DUF4143 domain-containing protein [Propioniciclava sp.]